MNENVPEHLPIWLNTYYFPNVLGEALRRGIESWDSNARIAILEPAASATC